MTHMARRHDSAPGVAVTGIAALCLAVLGATGTGRAQDPLDAGPTDGLFSLPRSQDDIAIWQEARREIAARSYEPAVERLHRLLREGSRGVVPILGANDRWTGMHRAVIETLRDLPPEGVQAYERLCKLEAGRAWEAPVQSLAKEQLEYLAETFPTSSRGRTARVRLGDLALVDGDGIAAQQQFRAALDATPTDSPLVPTIEARTLVAELLVRARAGRVDAATGPAGEALVALPPSGGTGWPAYGGGYDGTRPMDEPIGEPNDPYRLPVRADGFEINDYAMHAVGDLGGIYVNDGHSVHAIDPIGRATLWDAEGPMVDSDEIVEARGAINTDMMLACALSDDIVVASLQVPNDVVGASHTHRFRDVISIVQKIPSRRLFAFDRSTGKRLWSHWDYDEGPISRRFEGHDCCGAPIVQGDTIYVPTHDQTGAIAFYASAYDLRTGEPRWRRLICSSQQEVNMFGNARQEFAAGPIAIQGGVVYGTTNLGVCYAVDARDGELRWISGYPTIPLPRARLRDQEPRPVFFSNNPIVIRDGVMATTPLDSECAIGLDIETGRLLWRVPYDARDDLMVRWLLGALGDEFVFSGLGIVTVAARPDSNGRPAMRVIASPESLHEDHYRSTAIPRGGITDDRIWFVGSDGAIRILDERGNRDPRMARLQYGGRGNLLMVDGLVATLSDGQLLLWADTTALTRDASRRANAAEADPIAVLRLARLLRAERGADPEVLEKLFEKGLAAARKRGLGVGSPIHRQLADGLFELTMERASLEEDGADAVRLFELARSRASLPRQWLRAQQKILEIVHADSKSYLRELHRMAERFPEETFPFPDVGRVPIGVYAAWRGIEHLEDPREAARACQRLIQRYGDVRLGDETAGARAQEALAKLIERHGRGVLEEIEREAAHELETARDVPELLRQVIARFPLTDASSRAADRLLDVALRSNDLGAVARTYAQIAAGAPPRPGAQRRLIEAARRGGNAALAHAFAVRLRATAGDQPSDFPPDEGRTFADVLRDVRAPQAGSTPVPALPREVVAELWSPNAQTSYTYVPVRVAPGFPIPDPLPLFVSPSEGQLAVFDLREGRFDPRTPIALASTRGALQEPILLCGDVAVGVDAHRVFGLDLEAGNVRWELPADSSGGIEALAVVSGVLQVHAVEGASRSSGAFLLGVEPLTGAVLFRRTIPPAEAVAGPVAAADALWTLDASDPAGPTLRAREPLTGTVFESTPIRLEVLRFLGLDGSFARRLEDPTLRSRMFADSARVYLPVDIAMPDEPPRMVAIRRGTGELDWRWSGLPGRSLLLAGLHGDRVVVFEKSHAHARLSILNGSGVPAGGEFDFGRMATVRNWERLPLGGAGPVPDVLLVTDSAEFVSAPRLTAISVDADGPRFERSLEGTSRVLNSPLVGDGYLLVPLSRQGRTEPVIEIVDLRTRQGALPGGENVLRLDATHPMKVYGHGRHVIVETLDVLRVMGTPR